jgi:hypothetical protein
MIKGDIMSNKLLLGVARGDITPEVGCNLFGYRPDLYSKSVNDNLTATVFAFMQGEDKFVLITVCVCILDTKITDELRKLISEKHSVKKGNIIICATHTHSGPATIDMPGWGGIDMPYYEGIMKPVILKAVDEAFSEAQPVTMGVSVGKSDLGINRRQLNIDNSVGLGQCDWAPYNPQMTVISFKNEKGEITGNIIHYGCHGTCAGLNKEVSRDWSGVMTDALEKETGAITAFFNGPEGDVGPRLSNGQTTAELPYIYEVGGIGAKDAVNIFRSIKEYNDFSVSSVSNKVKLPYDKRISYEEAVEGCKKYSSEAINFEKQMSVYFNNVRASYEKDFIEEEFDEIEQSIIRIGDVAFVSFPYELFSVIGMRINEAVKDLNVLSLSNANGSKGYFPTQDQLCRGGYEVTMFKYNGVQCPVDDADYHLLKGTLENIGKLER